MIRIKDFFKAFSWNSIGITFYIACKWLITILVVRFSDNYQDAGYLALAMSLTNIFLCIAAYNIRNFQVSDINEEYSSNIYITTRLATIFISQVLFIIYCILYFGINQLSLIILIYMLLISGEAFSDVLQGISQKKWRMDIIGVSYVLRGIMILLSFIFLYKLFGLLIAVLGMSVLSLVVIIFYETKTVYKISSFKIEFNWNKITKLLKICFPLMLTGLLYVSFASIARIYLENTTNSEMLGIYNSATIIAVIVMQLCAFIFTPIVNILSDYISKNNFNAFNKMFLYVCGILIIIISIGFITVIFLGKHILNILFGQSIIPYTYLLQEALFVAGLTSFLWFLMIVLTIIRKINIILIGCFTGFLACVLTAKWSLNTYGISGANYMQIIGLSISLVILLFSYICNIIKLKQTKCNI